MGTVLLEVGRVLRPHGLAGDVVVELVTDRTERLAPGAELWSDAGLLRVSRSSELGGPPAPALSGRGTRWVVRFAGVGGREGAEDLRGAVLRTEPQDAGPDTLWVHELIGAEVRDRAGRTFGRVGAVEANPASDLLVLEGGGLVPLCFVVGHAPGLVTVEVPAGLLDEAAAT